jgi:hypothetical protein
MLCKATYQQDHLMNTVQSDTNMTLRRNVLFPYKKETAGYSETSQNISTSVLGITFKKAVLMIQRCENSSYVRPPLNSILNITIAISN